jgi:uncharacterized RmlC-like cupin family protein
MSSSAIHIVSPAEFDSGTAQTPGAEFIAAIAPTFGIPSAIWSVLFDVEPGTRICVHHHGKQETIAYVLPVSANTLESKRRISRARKAGDFIHVPAFLPHIEINPSKSEPFRWVIVRSIATPIVVNLPDETCP